MEDLAHRFNIGGAETGRPERAAVCQADPGSRNCPLTNGPITDIHSGHSRDISTLNPDQVVGDELVRADHDPDLEKSDGRRNASSAIEQKGDSTHLALGQSDDSNDPDGDGQDQEYGCPP
jgi:hypothetical protein